jgi:hypothetical protein
MSILIVQTGTIFRQDTPLREVRNLLIYSASTLPLPSTFVKSLYAEACKRKSIRAKIFIVAENLRTCGGKATGAGMFLASVFQKYF